MMPSDMGPSPQRRQAVARRLTRNPSREEAGGQPYGWDDYFRMPDDDFQKAINVVLGTLRKPSKATMRFNPDAMLDPSQMQDNRPQVQMAPQTQFGEELPPFYNQDPWEQMMRNSGYGRNEMPDNPSMPESEDIGNMYFPDGSVITEEQRSGQGGFFPLQGQNDAKVMLIQAILKRLGLDGGR